VKVVLSGDGGDEVFGGYDWYSHFLSEDVNPQGALKMLKLLFAKNLLRLMAKMGVPCEKRRDAAINAYVRAIIDRKYSDWLERHLAWVTSMDDRFIDSGVGMAITQQCTLQRGADEMDRISDFDLNCYLPGDILVKVDRAAMANSLEVRAPLLDVDLVEFMLSMPWSLRFKNGELKYMLKIACGDLWPDEVRAGRKQGFGAPIWAWLKRADVSLICKRVLGKNSWFSETFPDSSRFSASCQQRWNALCLGLWKEKHT